MISCNDAELSAVRTDFRLMAARWRLNQGELRALLGVCGPVEHGILPGELDQTAEMRMRLLLRLDRALDDLCDGSHVARLREPGPAGTGPTPLHALEDLATLRAVLAAAEGSPAAHRSTGTDGHDFRNRRADRS